jgi:hypothetical protein
VPVAGLVGGRGCDCDRVVHAGDFELVDNCRLLRSRGGSGGGSIDYSPTSHLVGDWCTVDWQGLNVKAGGRRARQRTEAGHSSSELLLLIHLGGQARTSIISVGGVVLCRCQGLKTMGSAIAYTGVELCFSSLLQNCSDFFGLLVVGDTVLHVFRSSSARALGVSSGGGGRDSSLLGWR